MVQGLVGQGRDEALKIHGDAAWIILLTIEHPSLTIQRFTNDVSDTISRGHTFISYPFQLELMNNSDGVPNGKLRINNISRHIWRQIEMLTTSPTFTFEIVLSTDPNTVIDSYVLAEFWRVSADVNAVEATLTHERYAVEPWPSQRMTPQHFPWLSR